MILLSFLKGSVSRVFRPSFFYDSNLSRPLINRLKYFRIRFPFHRDIRIFKNSVVCIPPRSQTPRCASYRGVKLHGVHHTAESITYQVSILIRIFTNAISLGRLKISSHKLFKKSFLLKTFFNKIKTKVVASTKTRKTDIFESV